MELRPGTCSARARAAGRVSPTAHPPRPSGTATRASGGALSSAKPPPPHATSGPTRWGAPPSSAGPARRPATRSRRGPGRARRRRRHGCVVGAVDPAGGVDDGTPARAATQVRERGRARRRRRRWLPCGRRRAARRMMMPGVQNPHWLAPASVKASAQRRRTSGSRPSRVVTSRPATRRAGVTQATRGAPSTHTVQHPHWPWGLHPSLAERRPRRSRRTSSSEVPSSGTATSTPSTRNETVGAGRGAPDGWVS